MTKGAILGAAIRPLLSLNGHYRYIFVESDNGKFDLREAVF